MKIHGFFILLSFSVFAGLLLFVSCPSPYAEPRITLPGEGSGPALKDELFVRDPENGAILFSTNSSENWSENGYTIWTVSGSDDDAFSSKEAGLLKMEGDATSGYGIVVCHHESAQGETAIILMINTSGEYIVGELVAGRFSQIIPWTAFPQLKPDINRENRVRLELIDGEFVVTLNGIEANRFRDEEAPFHSNGKSGYVVVISPLDDFPETSVRVVFTD
jgi:hypothetical protein